jgi:hypothetical protein
MRPRRINYERAEETLASSQGLRGDVKAEPLGWLDKFLLRHGRHPPTVMKAWAQAHVAWATSAVRLDHAAQEATLLDYIHEVDHVAARIKRLESAIDAAVNLALPACTR